MDIDDRQASQIHGILSSDSDSDSRDFDDAYHSLKPPPLNYQLIKNKIVLISRQQKTNIWEERLKNLRKGDAGMTVKAARKKKKKKLNTKVGINGEIAGKAVVNCEKVPGIKKDVEQKILYDPQTLKIVEEKISELENVWHAGLPPTVVQRELSLQHQRENSLYESWMKSKGIQKQQKETKGKQENTIKKKEKTKKKSEQQKSSTNLAKQNTPTPTNTLLLNYNNLVSNQSQSQNGTKFNQVKKTESEKKANTKGAKQSHKKINIKETWNLRLFSREIENEIPEKDETEITKNPNGSVDVIVEETNSSTKTKKKKRSKKKSKQSGDISTKQSPSENSNVNFDAQKMSEKDNTLMAQNWNGSNSQNSNLVFLDEETLRNVWNFDNFVDKSISCFGYFPNDINIDMENANALKKISKSKNKLKKSVDSYAKEILDGKEKLNTQLLDQNVLERVWLLSNDINTKIKPTTETPEKRTEDLNVEDTNQVETSAAPKPKTKKKKKPKQSIAEPPLVAIGHDIEKPSKDNAIETMPTSEEPRQIFGDDFKDFLRAICGEDPTAVSHLNSFSYEQLERSYLTYREKKNLTQIPKKDTTKRNLEKSNMGINGTPKTQKERQQTDKTVNHKLNLTDGDRLLNSLTGPNDSCHLANSRNCQKTNTKFAVVDPLIEMRGSVPEEGVKTSKSPCESSQIEHEPRVNDPATNNDYDGTIGTSDRENDGLTVEDSAQNSDGLLHYLTGSNDDLKSTYTTSTADLWYQHSDFYRHSPRYREDYGRETDFHESFGSVNHLGEMSCDKDRLHSNDLSLVSVMLHVFLVVIVAVTVMNMVTNILLFLYKNIFLVGMVFLAFTKFKS